MKRYTKNGEIKTRNQIVLRVTKEINGVEKQFQTICPTEEMILADGWIEYVIPEPTEEELLERAKRDLRNHIEHHDSSHEVNEFYMNGQPMWLDKATRTGLMLRLQAEQTVGKENTTLWYGTQQYELPISQAMQILYALEVYASQCYDVTQAHLAEVEKIQTIEDVENYDYTTGYPEKQNF